MIHQSERVSVRIRCVKEKVAPIMESWELEEWLRRKRSEAFEGPEERQWSSRRQPQKSSLKSQPQNKVKIGGEDSR